MEQLAYLPAGERLSEFAALHRQKQRRFPLSTVARFIKIRPKRKLKLVMGFV